MGEFKEGEKQDLETGIIPPEKLRSDDLGKDLESDLNKPTGDSLPDKDVTSSDLKTAIAEKSKVTEG